MSKKIALLKFRILVALLAILSSQAGAQEEQKPGGTGKPSIQTPQQQKFPMPDPYSLNLRIRTTIMALNQANLTGNYTVFRDLAAPAFQRGNDPSRLAEIFSELRKRQIDMSPIFFFNPKLVREPVITEDGLLRVSGFFETQPDQINFDMLFQFVDGRWRLYGVAVDTSSVTASTDSTNDSQNKKGTSEDAPQDEHVKGAAVDQSKPKKAQQGNATGR
jgi:hypothetical protein